MVWGFAKPMLERAVAVSNGRMTIDKLHDQIRSGSQHLWLIAENTRHPVAAFTTRIVDYPEGKMLNVQFLGGERMAEWVNQVDDLLNRVAIDAGCTMGIELTGRKGWKRALPSTWSEEFTSFRRPVLNDKPLSSGTAEPSGEPGGVGS